MMRQFGLIGFPLSHSFSKGYFAEKFARENISDAVYDNFPLSHIGEFEVLCEQIPGLKGLNVTIPYKEAVIPFLDQLEDSARQIGAVNTIRFSEGKKTGYNTDAYGFENSLRPLLLPHHTRALVLGTGGASKAVTFVLDKLGISWQYVSRTAKEGVLSYSDITPDLLSACPLIVNTTPLGMYPQVEALPPLPYGAIGAEHLLYDLVYNPPVTRFLEEGSRRGAVTINGLQMLHLQAERAWEIWNRS